MVWLEAQRKDVTMPLADPWHHSAVKTQQQHAILELQSAPPDSGKAYIARRIESVATRIGMAEKCNWDALRGAFRHEHEITSPRTQIHGMFWHTGLHPGASMAILRDALGWGVVGTAVRAKHCSRPFEI